jgi:hypothetical protein
MKPFERIARSPAARLVAAYAFMCLAVSGAVAQSSTHRIPGQDGSYALPRTPAGNTYTCMIGDGRLTGVSVQRSSGATIVLAQAGPMDDRASCGKGEKLVCYEDHEAQMSICNCAPSGGELQDMTISMWAHKG